MENVISQMLGRMATLHRKAQDWTPDIKNHQTSLIDIHIYTLHTMLTKTAEMKVDEKGRLGEVCNLSFFRPLPSLLKQAILKHTVLKHTIWDKTI